jgi:hypothetical protein
MLETVGNILKHLVTLRTLNRHKKQKPAAINHEIEVSNKRTTKRKNLMRVINIWQTKKK